MTSLNQDKKPDVSSSQPDIMAKMIKSLNLQPGKRVKDSLKRTVYFSTSIAGEASLWEEIKQAYEKFTSLGRPKRKRLSLKVDHDGTMTFFYEGREIAVVNPFC